VDAAATSNAGRLWLQPAEESEKLIARSAKLRVLGVGLVFSHGKDLRSGNDAFYPANIQ
jgi:hypothetical protein